MIRHLKHPDIDREKWDAVVAESGLIYAQSWYLDIVHPNWDALVDDDYQVVMPLTGGKKFGVDYLFQPFFVQQLGVFAKESVSPQKTSEFLRAIPRKYRFAEIKLNESNTFDKDVQGVEYHRNVLLDLNAPYDEIRAGYHANTKRNLAKAGNHVLRVAESVDLKQIVKLFREHRGASVSVWGDSEYDTLINLGAAAAERDAAFTVGVIGEGSQEPLCGALFMRMAGRVVFLFSGNSEKGKETQSMTFLLDAVIRRYANQCVVLDFEGSDDDNLARFYLGFGGKERPYPSYSYNKMDPAGKALLRFWKRIKTK